MSARIWTRSFASRFESGSSIRNTCGWRTIARPIATRWRWPPESSFGRRARYGVRSSIFAAHVDALLDHVPSAPAQPQAEGDVVGDRQVRVERVVLEHHRDVALLRREVVDDPAADRDRPVRDLLEPGDHPQRGRLAAARRADEHEELAVANLEREVVDRLDAVLVDLVDLVEHHVSHYPLVHELSRRGRPGRRPEARAPSPSTQRRRRRRAVSSSRASSGEQRTGVVGARAPRGRAAARSASRAGTRSRRRRRARSGSRRARARRSSAAARSAAGTVEQLVGPSVSGASHGIVRRASSPHSPSSPSSSPAKTIGTPGVVICRPTPTSWRSREPATVRKRACRGCRGAPTSAASTATGHRPGTRASRATIAAPLERAAADGHAPERRGRARPGARRRAASAQTGRRKPA